jgi:hypothetical protein
MTRLRRLIATALVDSFGLSLGWTVFSLQTTRSHGLAGLGLCNAAMLVGVALSAPVAARLSVRLDGRELLRVTCVSEAALRIGTFALLLAGAPLAVVVVAVAASNVVAWTGYAGMRAEVAAADPRGSAMTWYMVAVAAIEAAGTATAALLPTGPGGLVSGGLLVAVVAGYGACLLPTWLVAGGALVARAAPLPRAGGLRAVLRGGRLLPNGPPNGLLAFGGIVMLLGSGPTLLAVGLAAQLHGTRWVAGSALGIGMAGGWAFAAWSPVALLAAQLLSGMCMSALEGDMDARVATKAASPRGVTAGLATAAALRAFGSATAVALAPRVIAEAGIGWLGGALAASLTALAVLRLARRWSRSAADRVVGVATARDL